jgi:hypothetical protein
VPGPDFNLVSERRAREERLAHATGAVRGRYTNAAANAGSIRERFDLAEEVPAEGLGRANVSATQAGAGGGPRSR